MSTEESTEIKKKLEDHERRISKLESCFQTQPEHIRKKVSIKEFLLSKKPKGNVQKTLAVGYYLEKHKRLPVFNLRDLKDCFENAKEPVRKINDMVYKNIKQGYIMEMEAKEKKGDLKAWALTSTGEKFVEKNFLKEK